LDPSIEVRILASEPDGPLAQRQSGRLITGWSQVRILQGPLAHMPGEQKTICPKRGNVRHGRLMSQVLVLNATYEPMNVVSVRRAILLLLKEKAELVEAAEAQLRSERLIVPVPLVIRLVYYVRIPRRFSLPLSRRTVMARDHYTCQYCGDQPGKANLTIDHVLPRSRGGQTTWQNVVTACGFCNRHKGNRTPEEAAMQLLHRPAQPRYLAVTLLAGAGAPPVWDKYMYH
jgi:5-methylcytosine-specific restriction endonuclease McrA